MVVALILCSVFAASAAEFSNYFHPLSVEDMAVRWCMRWSGWSSYEEQDGEGHAKWTKSM